MKRKRIERYKNADKTQRDAIYRYTPADKNTKMPPPPIHSFSLFTPPPRQFYIDGVLPPGDTFFWNSPKANYHTNTTMTVPKLIQSTPRISVIKIVKPTTIRSRRSLVYSEHSKNFCNKDCKANYHTITTTTVPS